MHKIVTLISKSAAGLLNHSIVGEVVGHMLDRPKIVIPNSTGWVELKLINTFEKREYPSDTDSYTDHQLKTQDYYKVYGITIRNDKFTIGRVEAKIYEATIKVWNSQGQPVTERYKLRLWGGRKNSAVEPLFPNPAPIANEPKTLGEGGDLDLVIAYNQENEPTYYRFTIETHAENNFLAPRDLFKDAMPHYAHIEIQAHKLNVPVYLKIESSSRNHELQIKIISEKEFPLAKDELS